MSKRDNELKTAVGTEVASPWITTHQVQFKRGEVTKPVPIDHELLLTKIATVLLRETLNPAGFLTSAPVHVSQAPLPLGLMTVRTSAEIRNVQA